MKAIRKKPGCEPELVEVENTLKALQTEVGDVPEADFLMYHLREETGHDNH